MCPISKSDQALCYSEGGVCVRACVHACMKQLVLAVHLRIKDNDTSLDSLHILPLGDISEIMGQQTCQLWTCRARPARYHSGTLMHA